MRDGWQKKEPVHGGAFGAAGRGGWAYGSDSNMRIEIDREEDGR